MSRLCYRHQRGRKSGNAQVGIMNAVPPVMEVDKLVDAALVGFDRRETITIPSLPDADQ